MAASRLTSCVAVTSAAVVSMSTFSDRAYADSYFRLPFFSSKPSNEPSPPNQVAASFECVDRGLEPGTIIAGLHENSVHLVRSQRKVEEVTVEDGQKHGELQGSESRALRRL